MSNFGIVCSAPNSCCCVLFFQLADFFASWVKLYLGEFNYSRMPVCWLIHRQSQAFADINVWIRKHPRFLNAFGRVLCLLVDVHSGHQIMQLSSLAAMCNVYNDIISIYIGTSTHRHTWMTYIQPTVLLQKPKDFPINIDSNNKICTPWNGYFFSKRKNCIPWHGSNFISKEKKFMAPKIGSKKKLSSA